MVGLFLFWGLPPLVIRITLVLLVLYALAGVFTAPFHADESMYVSQSRDYVTYFVIGSPNSLRVDPPAEIDSPGYLRLLTGTVSTNLMGFVLWHTGYRDLDNWQAAWHYPDGIATNRAAGRIPPNDVLQRGRAVSALFLGSSIVLVALIGEKVASQRAGILAATVFTLNPVILLNGRRAMQEGALMFFTLMTVWAAMRAVEKRRWYDWLLLGASMALAFASKASALIPLAGIMLGVLLALHRFDAKALLLTGVSAITLFLVMTPAIWTNPPARMRLAIELRQEVLHGQTAASPLAHHSATDRITALKHQVFPGEIQYFESPDFADDDILHTEIVRYDGSPLRGVSLPAWIAIGLAGMGLLYRRSSPIMMCWAGLTLIGIAVMVPLGWQRYYLPCTLAAVIFTGLGLDFLLMTVQAFLPEKFRLAPRAAIPSRPTKL
jgi:hypothetical protein